MGRGGARDPKERAQEQLRQYRLAVVFAMESGRLIPNKADMKKARNWGRWGGREFSSARSTQAQIYGMRASYTPKRAAKLASVAEEAEARIVRARAEIKAKKALEVQLAREARMIKRYEAARESRERYINHLGL